MHLPALKSRSFRLYEGASLFSMNGLWISRIVVGWVAWELTGSATWVGLISFFLFAPTIATSPFFGVLMDRIRLRRAAIISHGIVTVATFFLFILQATGNLTIWTLSIVVLIIGIAASAERSVRMIIVARMVELHALPNAVAIHASNFNLARLTGPAIGGLLIERFGTGAAMQVNVALLLPFLVALFFLKVREKDESKAKRATFLADFRSGARHAMFHPVIREALILTSITSLNVRGVMEILPVLADGVFQRGAAGLGQMVAAGGAGALVAALIVALRSARKPGAGIPLIALVAVFVGLCSVAALGASSNWIVAMLFVTIAGFCGTMIGINMQSTIQLTVDDAFRGRVMSLWMVTGIGMSSIGALVLGSFSDIFGVSITLIFSGCAAIVAVSVARFLHFRAASVRKLAE